MALHFSIQACVTQAHCIRQDPSTTTQQCPRLSWLGKHMPSQLITRESSAANQRSDSLHLQDSSIVASTEQKPSCDLNRNNYLKVSQHSHAIMGPVAIASQLPSPKRATAKKMAQSYTVGDGSNFVWFLETSASSTLVVSHWQQGGLWGHRRCFALPAALMAMHTTLTRRWLQPPPAGSGALISGILASEHIPQNQSSFPQESTWLQDWDWPLHVTIL